MSCKYCIVEVEVPSLPPLSLYLDIILLSYAPWCPACRGLQPTWEEFGGWSEDLEIGVGQVDVTTSPGLSGRFMVTALPTIFQ